MNTIDVPTKSKLNQVAIDTPLEDLESDLAVVREAMRQLRTHETLLELAIEIKGSRVTVLPSVASHGVATTRADSFGENGKPRSLRSAILLVLKDADAPWSAAEIFEALEAHGWQPTNENARSQVAARLSKLVKRGDVVRLAPRQYVLPTLARQLAMEAFGESGLPSAPR